MTAPHGDRRCERCGQAVPGLSTRICPGCVAAEEREDEHRVVFEGMEKAFQAGAQVSQEGPPAAPQPATASMDAFAAVEHIRAGDWDVHLLQVLHACNQRVVSGEYREWRRRRYQ